MPELRSGAEPDDRSVRGAAHPVSNSYQEGFTHIHKIFYNLKKAPMDEHSSEGAFMCLFV